MGAWAAGASLLGGWLGASEQRRAAEAQADAVLQASREQIAYLRELAAPYNEMTEFALPKMRETIMNQYAPKIGQENPYLKAASAQALTGIERGRQTALGQSAGIWGRSGNLGRARGEGLRINRSATEAANAENVRYGLQAKGEQDTALGNYYGALSGAADIGRTALTPGMASAQMGMNAASEAAGIRGQAGQQYSSGMGTLLGWTVGDLSNAPWEQKWQDALLGYLGGRPTTTATSASAWNNNKRSVRASALPRPTLRPISAGAAASALNNKRPKSW